MIRLPSVSDWRRHFRREPTDYERYRALVAEGHGYADAHRMVYGEPPFTTMRQCAEYWHRKGYSLRHIEAICKLWFGKGSRSHIHRILNADAYQKHLRYKRKSS